MSHSRRSISAADRRRRLSTRHHLAAPADGDAPLVTIARNLVGIHSTDPASVFLALRARADNLSEAEVERALYEERSLTRILAMRRTVFVVPREWVPTIHAAVTAALAAGERRRTLKMLADAGIARHPERWFDRVIEATLQALAARGEASASELSQDVPALGTRIAVGAGTKWAGSIGVSTRALFWLATAGYIVRARPLGSWRSTLYRWAPTRDWLGIELPPEPSDAAHARGELLRRYLRAYGPVTFTDVQWWTGWTKAQARAALATVEPAEVELDGEEGWMLADDLEAWEAPPASSGGDRVVLLPALDSTTMGWKQRHWYLGDLAPRLFDRNGNAGPTIWYDGGIVGGWAQRDDGEVVVRMLADTGAELAAAADAEAARLTGWLGDVRIVPRFRTPLERELSA